MNRCSWPGDDALCIEYHDKEWGVPLHDDQKLFEFIVLDAAQAGLSWITVLRKRENYREAFDQFNAEKIARYDKRKLERLMQNPGIIRNRLKVESAVKNAQAYLQIKEQYPSFDQYIWQFVDGKPMQNHRKTLKDIPATTPQSDAMSKDMKKRGFTFVGSTICYAFMQAAGMANDHVVDCFRHSEVSKM